MTKKLTLRERELVAIGAALASNCVPCIESHIPAARSAGLSDAELDEAVRLADAVRQVPAAKVLHVALTMLGNAQGANDESAVPAGAPCCAASPGRGLS